jgi:membrane associated rhomboid family serine protease
MRDSRSAGPVWSFTRVVLLLISVFGLVFGSFMTITSMNWVVFLFVFPIFGAMFFMAVAGWPLSWFTPKEYDSTRYRRLTRLDYALLAAMAIPAGPLFWIASSSWLKLPAGFDPALIATGVLLATGLTTYSWQTKLSIGRGAALGSLLLTGIGAFMAFGDPGHPRDAFMGFALMYSSIWSVFRAGLLYTSDSSAPLSAPQVTSGATEVNGPVKRGMLATIPVTSGILVVLCLVFVAEVLFGVGSSNFSAPSLDTLIAFGGLNKRLVLQSHEWYRILTSTVLHANVLHLFFNAYALFLVGALFENFVGRIWYLAIYVIGGIGGSLMSLALDPANLVSIGASGAIMALFAATYITSFRRAEDENRKKLQKGLVQILVLSLIPFIGIGGGRIDIAGHLGGMVAGLLMGAFLYFTWDEESGKPRF